MKNVLAAIVNYHSFKKIELLKNRSVCIWKVRQQATSLKAQTSH